jgi:outer membrane cobalamin receptor
VIASVGAEAPALGGIVTASASGRYADMGLPGTTGWATPEARQVNADARGTVDYTNDTLAGGTLVLDASAFGSWSLMDYENPATSEDSRHESVSAGSDLRSRLFLGDSVELPAGLEFRFDGGESTNLGAEYRTRLHVGAYAAPVLSPVERLQVSPSVRFDWYDDYTAGLTYALGVSGLASDSLTLKVTGGRSYRAPSFNDLYWLDAYMQGNPDLDPETSWYVEAGAEARTGVVDWSLFGYARYTEDLITWTDDDGDWVYIAENLDAAAFFGTDAEASLDLGGFDVAASYALLLSYSLAGGKTLSDGARMVNTPVHTIKLEPGYESGGLRLSLRGSWRSERYINATTTLDPVFLLGARAQYAIQDSVSVYLDADNLLNADYVETNGYPMPGMTLKTGIRITLD